MNDTSERLAGIINRHEFKVWTINEVYEQFVRSGGEAKKKTVKNLLAAHPDITVIKSGSSKFSPVIGYNVRREHRKPSYEMAWETFRYSFTVWPYPLIFGVFVSMIAGAWLVVETVAGWLF